LTNQEYLVKEKSIEKSFYQMRKNGSIRSKVGSDPPNTISTTFVPEKYNFLHTLEMLRSVAELCLMAGYERGTIETINMMVRACANVQDF